MQAIVTTALHEDAFYAYFEPYRHPETQGSCWGDSGLETYGEDYQLVRRLDPAFVWTVLDGYPDQWIVPGIHYVNRVCYLVTRKPHNWIAAEFRVPRYDRSLTSLGLKRQMNKISRLLSSASIRQDTPEP